MGIGPQLTVSVDLAPQLLAEGLVYELIRHRFRVIPGRASVGIIDAATTSDSNWSLELVRGDEIIVHRPETSSMQPIQGVSDLVAILHDLFREIRSTDLS